MATISASLTNASLIVSTVSAQYISTTNLNISSLQLNSVSVSNLVLTTVPFNGGISISSLNYGLSSGISSTSSYRIAIGPIAGMSSQSHYAIGIGYLTGFARQETSTIAIGAYCQQFSASIGAIAIGFNCSNVRAGENTIAIGYATHVFGSRQSNVIALGWTSQASSFGQSTISLGTQTGQRAQAYNTICIGYLAGNSTMGAHAVAIGHNAGISSAWASSIILNATSGALSSLASGLYVNPIRFDGTASSNMLHYDATTKEITTGQSMQVSSGIISTINTNIISSGLVLAAQLGIGMTSTLSTSIQLQLSGDNAVKLTTTTWKTSSDARVKLNIVPASLSVCYSTIASLPLKRFTWDSTIIHATDTNVCGFIAQDIETVMPALVTKVAMNGYSDFRILNIDQIQKMNIGATKHMISKISSIKAEIKSLEDLIL